MTSPLIIRGSLGKQALLLLAGLAFAGVGSLMLTLPPPANPLLGWSSPVGRIAQVVVGVLAVLLGVITVVTLLYTATRPIVLLYDDYIVDARRKLTIPCADIREVTVARSEGRGALQWLLLNMHDPAKYAAFERLSKQSRLSTADLTLDLTLASQTDFERAHRFIAGRIR